MSMYFPVPQYISVHESEKRDVVYSLNVKIKVDWTH